jgi:hypothetical protein
LDRIKQSRPGSIDCRFVDVPDKKVTNAVITGSPPLSKTVRIAHQKTSGELSDPQTRVHGQFSTQSCQSGIAASTVGESRDVLNSQLRKEETERAGTEKESAL